LADAGYHGPAEPDTRLSEYAMLILSGTRVVEADPG